jgi:hypothetical protein
MRNVLIALVINLVAQKFGGSWGGALAGLVIGGIMPTMGARAAAVTAPVAAGGLLGLAALQGAPLADFAARVAGNFALPPWVPIVAAVVLPGLQAGGMAGAVGGIRGLLRPTAPTG